MRMNIFENIIITEVKPPCVAHFEKDQHSHMVNRPGYGLAVCISGRNKYTMNGQTYYLDPGHAILLTKNAEYTIHSLDNGSFPFIDFTCENFHCPQICTFPLEDTKSLLKDYDTIRDMFLFHESRLDILSLFYKVLSKVAQVQQTHHNPLLPVMHYIEENISNPHLTNNLLAAELNISEVYLRKLFSAHYNTSPRQYVLNLRIQKAKQLLTDTPLRMTTIAEQCGFSSQYHFCRIFKERTGLTPTQYAVENRVYNL